MAKLTDKLLREAHRAAARSMTISLQISEAFVERYGRTHSDVDCDEIIDCLDYGHGLEMTIAECDRAMTEAGCPPLKRK